MSKFKQSLICSAILASLPVSAEIFQLGEIEVVEHQSSLSTATVSQSEIEKNKLSNVAEVAKITPGVFLQRSGNRAEHNILVRGFGATRVPVFIDGIPVYVPYDGNMDIGRFTTFDLARIDISKGASSILYGANTMGGAINLISQKPTKALEGTISYGTQSGQDSNTTVNQTYFNLGTKQQYFYAQLSGSLVERQGLQLPQDFQPYSFNTEQGGRAENSASQDKKISLKLAYTPNSTDEYALSLTSQKGKKQQPLYSGDVQSSERYWRWPAWNKDSIYFLSHTQFSPYNLYLNTKVFWDSFTNDLDTFDDATFSTPSSSSYYRDYSYGAGFELGGDLNAQDSLKFSAIYKYDVHRDHDDDNPVVVDKDRTYSLGLENTYRFSEATKLIAGISYDYRQGLRAESYQQLDSSSTDYGIYRFDLGNQHAFNYQVKLAHSFGNDELSLSFAKKTRFPTMKDRYSRKLGKNEPNPYLKAETANHYELAYWKTFGHWLKLEGALFYSEISDAIESIALESGLEQNQNYGKEVFKGLELAATVFASDNLNFGANYSYIRAKNRTDSSYIIKDVPRHKGFIYADWKLLPQLSLYFSQELETGRYSTNGTGKNATTAKLSGFGVSNLQLSYQVNQHLTVDAGVNNLFDRNYYYAAGYPEEGRVYFAKVKYQF